MKRTKQTTLILSDIDCTKYPQPMFLARAIARNSAAGSCHLLDPFGLHHFTSDSDPDIQARRIPLTLGSHARSWTRYIYEALRLRPDTIVAINETNLAPAFALSRNAIGTVRFGAYFLDFWEDDLAIKTRRLHMGHRTLRSSAPWLDFVIDCEEERLKRRAWINAKRHRTFVLHNAPPREFAPLLNRTHSKGVMRIVYAGRNDPNVGIEFFLRAFARLESPSEAHFYLTGHEDRNQRIRAKANSLKLSSRVYFHEPISKSALQDVYANSDVGLSLYPCAEGVTNMNDYLCAPNKTFEYLASGLSTLASANPTLQFIEREQLGVCVNPRDVDSIHSGLLRLANAAAYESMGQRAREYYENQLSYEREVAPILAYLSTPTEM